MEEEGPYRRLLLLFPSHCSLVLPAVPQEPAQSRLSISCVAFLKAKWQVWYRESITSFLTRKHRLEDT